MSTPHAAGQAPNVDPRELALFDKLASRWWDPEGEFATLHAINPLRLGYIDGRASLAGKRVVDVGCGGGILSESMALKGAQVTGIDMSHGVLSVARLHCLESGAKVEYREITAERLAAESPHHYDVVTCMELLEHVPDPVSLVAACAQLVRPGGHVFFSTLNRTLKAYLFAVIGAERVLRLLPKGTHDYARFIKPSELLDWARAAGLRITDLTGLQYNPLTRSHHLGGGIAVNYLAHARSD